MGGGAFSFFGSRKTSLAFGAAAGALVALAAPGAAYANGEETIYDDGYCGGADFTEGPTLSPFTDLPYLVSAVDTVSNNPASLYYGPMDPDPYTNWYLEFDLRDQLAKLAVMRGILDKYNLWDMYLGWFPTAPACEADDMGVRRLDGSCNDLVRPAMGSAGMRFGRNIMPLQDAAKPNAETLMSPSPREVSRKLFTRGKEGTREVPFLNMLAVAWIQFQVHDWFNHTKSTDEFLEIPLEPGDPLRKHGRQVMKVAATETDPSRQAWEAGLPPMYQNEVTHWWDASQLYGSDQATADSLREFDFGHLLVDDEGMLIVGDEGFERSGFAMNWWVGLGLMHNLFAQHHNYIADELAAAYPAHANDDQWLYDHARMINAATIVKIHTIEWTPAILPNPALGVGMNANWDGINQYMDPPIDPAWGVVPPEFESIVFGVAGGEKDLKQYPSAAELQAVGVPAAQAGQIAGAYQGDVPFTLTEEFVSVYRMHTMLPDKIEIKRLDTGHGHGHGHGWGHGNGWGWGWGWWSHGWNQWKKWKQRKGAKIPLALTRDARARKLEEKYGLANLLYSFGNQKPGGLVLDNYPRLLQNLHIPFQGPLDLGAVDVLRDRERGIPRYNEFRRQINLRPVTSFEELTDDAEMAARISEVYDGDIEQVDLLVGTLAEGTRPTCYGFGETLFQVFTLMATRRIQADRFYTTDFTPEVYTERGMELIDEANMVDILLLHYPELWETGLADQNNAFFPWDD